MGAGHTVTVLYEIVPAGATRPRRRGDGDRPAVDPLKYQTAEPAAPRPAVDRPAKTALRRRVADREGALQAAGGDDERAHRTAGARRRRARAESAVRRRGRRVRPAPARRAVAARSLAGPHAADPRCCRCRPTRRPTARRLRIWSIWPRAWESSADPAADHKHAGNNFTNCVKSFPASSCCRRRTSNDTDTPSASSSRPIARSARKTRSAIASRTGRSGSGCSSSRPDR